MVPRAVEPSYLNWIRRYIEQHKIGLFIPTSEAEIAILNAHGAREIAGACILIANQKSINVSLDKRICMSFLEKHGLRVPHNGVVGETEPVSYPVIKVDPVVKTEFVRV